MRKGSSSWSQYSASTHEANAIKAAVEAKAKNNWAAVKVVNTKNNSTVFSG